jgi:hypothetical protein
MPPPRPMTGRGISLDLLHCPLGSVTERKTPPVLGFGGCPEPQSPPIRGENLPRGLTASAAPTPGPFWR